MSGAAIPAVYELKPGCVYIVSPDRHLTPHQHAAIKQDWKEALDALPKDQRPLVLINATPLSVVEMRQPPVVMEGMGS